MSVWANFYYCIQGEKSKSVLKGQCREIFCLWFFHESLSSQPQSIPLRPFRMTLVAKLLQVSTIWRQICHLYQRHLQQIFPPVSLVLFITVANLPPVSTISANNGNNYQTADNLKWTWIQKFIYLLTLLPKGSERNNENISDWRFFPFATVVNDTVGAPWAANISTNCRKNGPNGIIRGL